MITAMQSAKLDAANKLLTSREQLASTIAFICWNYTQQHKLYAILSDLDKLLLALISDEPAGS